jgi:1-acyl-sn-glycerol-3-phosphate acyltransferase
MIISNHKKWAQFVFYKYINFLLRRNFRNFYLVNTFPEIEEEAGLVITPNHISWWDGFFAGYIEKLFLHRTPHIMMLEKQLNKYWFFSNVGAYSINPGNTKSIIESALYTRDVISNSQNSVIIFPQGEIEAFEKRPLKLKKGLQLFVHGIDSNFYILPIAFKIQHFEEKNPAVIVRFGKLLEGKAVQSNLAIYEEEFLRNLDKLNNAAYTKSFYKDLFEK